MERRTFIRLAAGSASFLLWARATLPGPASAAERIERLVRSDAEWKKRLGPAQ